LNKKSGSFIADSADFVYDIPERDFLELRDASQAGLLNFSVTL